MATESPVCKTSVKVWHPVIDRLNEKLEAACLRRDAYLARVLEVELGHLDAEVCLPNSRESHDYVLRTLDRFERKLVSLALPTELVERMNAICKRKRIVRDAFINRLLLLLTAPGEAVDRLLFDDEGGNWRELVWTERRHDGPALWNLFNPLKPEIDPFWALREAFDLLKDETLEPYRIAETGEEVQVCRTMTGDIAPPLRLYTKVFRGTAGDGDPAGFSCYLPDSDIPGHEAEQRLRAKVEDVLASLGAPR